jgi:hypothetical protein
MILPEILSPADVEDVLVRVGMGMDRRNVARALHQAPIHGVVPPARSGIRWRIPRAALPHVIAACLWRRAQRALAPGGEEPGSPADHLGEALELMASRRWLAALVPAELKPALRRQRRAALRRQREWQRQERERQERWECQHQAEAEARRRAREEEADRVCRRAAYRDFGSPKGAYWPQEPENQPFVRDWPTQRPAWWRPPPGLLEAVAADLPRQRVLPYREPDWGPWVPPYVPGRP